MKTKINNYDSYNMNMKKSLRDKLFWLGLLDEPITAVVDFGCADGELFKLIQEDFPSLDFYGVDNNPEMIKLAKKNFPDGIYIENLKQKRTTNKHALLNFSSVWHEIYSYCTDEEIKEIAEAAFDGYTYVAIRDFMVSEKISRSTPTADYQKLMKKADPRKVKDFEQVWGSLTENRNFVHFLMKYDYNINWEREVRENYFGVTLEQFLKVIPHNYEIIYFCHYILPFTKMKIRKDFEINLVDNTHVKILLKRRD